MNFDELEQLMVKNDSRMKNITALFEQKKAAILGYHEVNQNMKESWSIKEKYKDCSTSYPSYGRQLTPNIKMNTFMIQ